MGFGSIQCGLEPRPHRRPGERHLLCPTKRRGSIGKGEQGAPRPPTSFPHPLAEGRDGPFWRMPPLIPNNAPDGAAGTGLGGDVVRSEPVPRREAERGTGSRAPLAPGERFRAGSWACLAFIYINSINVKKVWPEGWSIPMCPPTSCLQPWMQWAPFQEGMATVSPPHGTPLTPPIPQHDKEQPAQPHVALTGTTQRGDKQCHHTVTPRSERRNGPMRCHRESPKELGFFFSLPDPTTSMRPTSTPVSPHPPPPPQTAVFGPIAAHMPQPQLLQDPGTSTSPLLLPALSSELFSTHNINELIKTRHPIGELSTHRLGHFQLTSAYPHLHICTMASPRLQGWFVTFHIPFCTSGDPPALGIYQQKGVKPICAQLRGLGTCQDFPTPSQAPHPPPTLPPH